MSSEKANLEPPAAPTNRVCLRVKSYGAELSQEMEETEAFALLTSHA